MQQYHLYNMHIVYVNLFFQSLLHRHHCHELHHYLHDHQLQHVLCEHYCGSFSRDGAEVGWHLSFMLTPVFFLSFQALVSVDVNGRG